MGIEFFVSFETMRGFQRASSYRQEKNPFRTMRSGQSTPYERESKWIIKV